MDDKWFATTTHDSHSQSVSQLDLVLYVQLGAVQAAKRVSKQQCQVYSRLCACVSHMRG